jgi:hypothetical protein
LALNLDIRKLYLYLVSFVMIMMMIVGIVQALQGVVNIFYPNPNAVYPETKAIYPPGVKDPIQLTEAEKKEAEQRDKTIRTYNNVQSIVNSLIMVVVASPVFFYHRKQIKDYERREKL